MRSRSRWEAFIVALGVAGPLLAQARPAALYPIQGDGVSPSECSELEGTLKSALVRMSRGGSFEPASPLMVTASCGPARTADPACLARAAGTGVILFGVARRSGAYLVLALSAVDAHRAVSGPVRVKVDPIVDDPGQFVAALEQLAASPVAPPNGPPSTPLPMAAGPVPPRSGPPGTPPPLATPAPRPPIPPAARPKAPAAAVESSASSGSGAWLGRGAVLSGAGALAVLGGGLTSGYLAQKANDELVSKYAAHTLVTGDAASYSRVQRYDRIANVLFIVSGALAVTALTLWALIPDEDDGARSPGRL